MSKSHADDEQTSVQEQLHANENELQQLLQQQKTTDFHLAELGGMVHVMTQMVNKLSPVSPVTTVPPENSSVTPTTSAGTR